MIKKAKENNVYLEINIGGFRRGIQKLGNEIRYPFPHKEFWKLVKKVGNKVVIGVDAHNPNQFGRYDEIELAINFAKELEIEVSDHIEI